MLHYNYSYYWHKNNCYTFHLSDKQAIIERASDRSYNSHSREVAFKYRKPLDVRDTGVEFDIWDFLGQPWAAAAAAGRHTWHAVIHAIHSNPGDNGVEIRAQLHCTAGIDGQGLGDA